MSRRVFKPSQVAHLWATQSQDEARNSQGNFRFQGKKIYSYAVCIAQILDDGTILRDQHSYSNTTSQHQSCVWRALSKVQEHRVIRVADAGATAAVAHASNHRQMREEYESLLRSAAKPRIRSTTRASLLEQAETLRIKANDYRERFCKGVLKQCPKIPENADLEATLEKLRKRDAKELAAQAARIEAQRIEHEKEVAGELKHWYKVGLPAWKQGKSWNSWKGLNKERRVYKTGSPPHGAPIDFRLINGGEDVKTTLGAEFPKRHCARAFQAIMKCRATSTPWKRNGEEVRVGLFMIDKIDEHGNVKAGCHEIKWETIAAFAKELGLDSSFAKRSWDETRTDGFSRSDKHSV